MSTNKHIDRICIAVVIVSLILTGVFMHSDSLGVVAVARTIGYEDRLFDISSVHTIDIVMDDWDSFIENCESEEYSSCALVIDGESFKNIAIRAKGNTSLSSVKSMGSERYSFKLEFDHYDKNKSYYGLDKLCLNNLIQDNTMMKDFLAYQMMYGFGVDAPMCSYVYITVNGEDWGLYLAVEGIEDSFLERNYGGDTGNLYKPDSLGFGGGRGNGRDFKMEDLDFDSSGDSDGSFSFGSGNFNFGRNSNDDSNRFGFGGGFGMGSSDVKLQYIDDDPDSYSNIFENAKTDITTKDKERLISSLKDLSSYSNLENVLDMDEVLRYFVVHNFVINGDSYTGSMIHNYYLHESDGKLAMIPWDYNLAFGTFMGGDASDQVNSSIDSPVSGGMDDRPMVGWIFSDEEYTAMYHELFAEFIEEWFDNGKLARLISDTTELIRPYVEKDPTKFCTLEDFDEGVSVISQFTELRAEAVRRQLNGDSTKVDTNGLNLSSMGTMGSGGGFGGGDRSRFGGGNRSRFGGGDMPSDFGGGNRPDFGGRSNSNSDSNSDNSSDSRSSNMPGNFPGGFEGGDMRSGFDGGDFSGNFPSDFGGGNFPSDFGGGNFPSDFGGNMPSNFSGFPDTSSSSTASQPWLWVGISAAVLLAGLVIAKKKTARYNLY